MKFFTCPGAASGKNVRVMLPNLVSMIAFVAVIFLLSFGVSVFAAFWAYVGAPATMLKITTKGRRYFFIVQPPSSETYGYYGRNVLFYQKHRGMSNKTWTGGRSSESGGYSFRMEQRAQCMGRKIKCRSLLFSFPFLPLHNSRFPK